MIPGSANPLLLAAAAEAGPYQISRSVRFNSSDSAFCSRVPSTAGNRKTFTWSLWCKRGILSSSGTYSLFGANSGSASGTYLAFHNDTLRLRDAQGGTTFIETSAVYRDASAWYHIVLSVDTTQATADNRIRLYVNGEEVTTFGTRNNPSQNADLAFNSTNGHMVGGLWDTNYSANLFAPFDGYLADVYLVDGQALTPSSFTETDATTGQLVPIEYTGTYGTNGFHLPFSDNSSAAALGTDTSGNSNTWTVNNISVTAGSGNDSLVDTPTSYGTDTGAGGEVRGNYCTWNPLKKVSGATAVNGNLAFTVPTDGGIASTFAVSSGKWYWEVVLSSGRANLGLATTSWDPAIYPGYTAQGWSYSAFNGNKIHNASSTSYGASFTTGDVIGVAFDADAGTLTFYKNGVSQGQAFSGITGSVYQPALGADGGTTGAGDANFGQRPFAYTAPSGFKALCTANLDDPLVAQPSTVMDVVKYDGNGSTQTISGLGFSPDFAWIKVRNGTVDHVLYDQVRGVQRYLSSNTTGAEGDQTGTPNVGLYAFTSDGFSVGDISGGSYGVNGSSGTYVAWTWDAGSTTASNTDGSITSSVRANASAGFSIVGWAGTGANATVGHGLNVTPGLVIVKNRDAVASWAVWHTALTGSQFLGLNTTNAIQTSSAYWNSTTPTSSVLSVGTDSSANGSSNDMIAYCFAPVVGYSSAFSYTGNGASGYPNADGPYIHLGFRPRLILIKCSSAVENWVLYDTARSDYNYADDQLYPNLSNAEATGANREIDILSNGFKVRSNGGIVNTNAATYVGFAWAESPFQYARAR